MVTKVLKSGKVRITPSVASNWLWKGDPEYFTRSVITSADNVHLYEEVTNEQKEAIYAEWLAEQEDSNPASTPKRDVTE